MGIVLTHSTLSTYGAIVTVNIHDLEAGSDSTDEMSLRPNIVINGYGNINEVYDHTLPASIQIEILKDNSAVDTFFDNLIQFQEGRFFIEIEIEGEREFLGRVVIDTVELTDEVRPFISLEAADGLAELKYIKMDKSNAGSVIEFFQYALSRISTVENFYNTTEPLLGTSVHLKSSHTDSSSGNVLERLKLNNYFYKKNTNDTIEYMTCDLMVKEFCTRFNMRLIYAKGMYWLVDYFSYVNENWNFRFFSKSSFGTVSGTAPSTAYITVHQTNAQSSILAGGKFMYEASYKRASFKVNNVEIVNKSLADGVYLTNGAPLKYIGPLVTGVAAYILYLNFEISPIPLPDDKRPIKWILLVITIALKDGLDFTRYAGLDPDADIWWNSSTNYTRKLVEPGVGETINVYVPVSPGSTFVLPMEFPEWSPTESRELSISYAFGGFFDEFKQPYDPGPYTLPYNVFIDVSYDGTQNINELIFKAENNTTAVKDYAKDIIASNTHANELSRFYYDNTGSGLITPAAADFYYGADSPNNLEVTVLKQLLKPISQNIKYAELVTNTKVHRLSLFRPVKYKLEYFFIRDYAFDVKLEKYRFNGFKYKEDDPPTVVPPVITIEEPTPSPETPPSEYSKQIQITNQFGLLKPLRWLIKPFNAQFWEIPYVFDENWTEESILACLDVFINGDRQAIYIDDETPTENGTVHLQRGINNLIWSRTMNDDTLEVKLIPLFEIE